MRLVALPFGYMVLIAILTASRASAQSSPMTRQIDLTQLTLDQLMNLEVQTASLTTELLADAPARVEVITRAQIQRRGYRSLLDVLEDISDFKVDLRSNWDFPSELTVQGVRGAGKVIVLLDGIRISAPTNEPLPIVANYPVHNARQIEIVYSPASAVYGADAFSAVINIITVNAVDGTGLRASSSAGTGGLYDQTISYSTRLGRYGELVVDGQFQYDRQPDLSRAFPADFAGLQAQRTGVFPTIFGVMTPSTPVSPDYHIPLFAHSLHGKYRAGGLQISLFTNRSHLPTTAGIFTPDNVVYDDSAFNDNRFTVAAGSYTRRLRAVASTSTLTLSRHELEPDSGYRDLYSNMERSYKFGYGSMLKAEQQLSWTPAARLTLMTGGTLERFFAIPQTADLNAPLEAHDQPGTILGTNIVDDLYTLHYANVGAFAQMRYAMTRRLAVTVGARGDRNTRYGSTFTPRAGLVAQAPTGTTVKLLYGTAYLAPSPYQAYQHYGSFLSSDGGETFASPYWHLPNPDLKPQRKQTVETNVTQRLGSEISITASAFRSWFTNLIQPANPHKTENGEFHGWPVDVIEHPTNEGNQMMHGVKAALDAVYSFGEHGRFEGHADVSLVDGAIRPHDDVGVEYPVGGMAPIQFRLHADLDWRDTIVSARTAIVGTQRLIALTDETRPSRRTIDGYWTTDLTVRRRGVFVNNVDVFLIVENAFDRRYRAINERAYINPEEFIGVPQNPRRISVGVALHLP